MPACTNYRTFLTCKATSEGKPFAKVDLTDDETGYNVGYGVFWSEGGRTVHAHPDAVETVLAVRHMVKRENLEVGSLAKKKKVWRTERDPFGPDDDGSVSRRWTSSTG